MREIDTHLHCDPGDLETKGSGRVSYFGGDEKGGGLQLVTSVDDLLQFVGGHGRRE